MKKVAIVTGASSGIGHTIAKYLAKEGYQVYGLARRVALMENLKEYGVIPIELDISSTESIKQSIENIKKQEKYIDLLINCAGYGIYSALEDGAVNEGRKIFDVNVFGLMEITQAVLPYMRQQNSGTIINISSVVGKVAFPFMGWYSASKFAVEALSSVLRFEVEPFNIKVVVIGPGRVKSEFGQVATNLSHLNHNSPYYNKMSKFQELIDNNPIPADSSDSIAKTVIKIVRSKNPKYRYNPNLDGKLAVLGLKWFGEKFINKIIRFKL